ncbi:hypothetical protein KY329_05370, partial [Candidatus Woesearchaeota archaeon]|nr:hypothetical protein [Candidatus Woesearchaeota archaeon]
LLLLLALVLLSVNVAARSEVRASVLRYSPTPAEQGNTFEVWIQLANEGTQADNVAVQFVSEYPFSLPEGEDVFEEVGTIPATEDVVVKYNVYVDVNAPSGERTIKFQYRYDSDNWIQIEAPITLQTQDAALIVKDYAIQPAQVAPGQEAKITMTLQNVGRIGVKNVDVSLDLLNKFSTLGTGSVQRISSIGAGKEAQVTFTLASDISTEVQLYNLPVNIKYLDDRNKQYETSAKISLAMNAPPEIDLMVDSTDFSSKTAPGEVGIKIVNKGVVNIKYATVTLVSTDDYKVLSPSNQEYVGNLDNDDYETVNFMIKPNVKDPVLTVTLEFKDPYNKNFMQQYQLPLRIFTARELGKAKSPWGTIIFVVIIAAGIFWWWRRKKKKKK